MQQAIFIGIFGFIVFAYVISLANLPYYQYYNLIVKLFAGIAPFAAAFGAYYIWSKIEKKN